MSLSFSGPGAEATSCGIALASAVSAQGCATGAACTNGRFGRAGEAALRRDGLRAVWGGRV